jgi:hypothetical protein
MKADRVCRRAHPLTESRLGAGETGDVNESELMTISESEIGALLYSRQLGLSLNIQLKFQTTHSVLIASNILFV